MTPKNVSADIYIFNNHRKENKIDNRQIICLLIIEKKNVFDCPPFAFMSKRNLLKTFQQRSATRSLRSRIRPKEILSGTSNFYEDYNKRLSVG